MNGLLLAVAVLAMISAVLLRERAQSRFRRLLGAVIALPFAMFIISAITALAWFHLRMPPEQSLPFIALAMVALPVSVLVQGVRSGRSGAALASPPTAAGHSDAVVMRSALPAVGIAAIFFFPLLFASLWIGSGTYPPVFFNVDTAFYLTQIQALVRAENYPPDSLNALGVARSYHYGTHIFAALLPRFSLLPAHTAMFWVVVPMLLVGIAALVARLALLAAGRGAPLWLGVLSLLFLIEYPLGRLGELAAQLPSHPGDALANLTELALRPGAFGGGYPIVSNLVGAFVVLAIGLAMADRTMPFRLAAIAIACGTLPLFKSAFIVPVGLWIGVWALFVCFRERRIGPLLAAAAALLIAIALSAMSVEVDYHFQLSLSVFSHGDEWQRDILQGGVLPFGALLVTAMLLIAVLRWRQSPAGPAAPNGVVILLTALVILAVPVFVVVTYLDENGQPKVLSESMQWFTPLHWIPAIALVVELARNWANLDRRRRVLVSAVVVLIAGLPLVAKLHDAAVLVAKPSGWYEFVDNAAIAPALAAIPVEGSVVAINDLHYPADNFVRDWRQFQVAALFGHQAYAAAPLYDPPEDAAERVRQQALLAGREWTPLLSEIACQAGWTHVLLSARKGFILGVPGQLIYESPDFRVYALPAC